MKHAIWSSLHYIMIHCNKSTVQNPYRNLKGIPFFSGRNITIRQASPPRHRNADNVRFRPNLNNRKKLHSSLKNLINSSVSSQPSYLKIFSFIIYVHLLLRHKWQMWLIGNWLGLKINNHYKTKRKLPDGRIKWFVWEKSIVSFHLFPWVLSFRHCFKCLPSITLFNPNKNPVGMYYYILHLLENETETRLQLPLFSGFMQFKVLAFF